jgi:hypothetical protein
MRPLTTDQITEGLAECMVMFRDDMIHAGVITEATPPMFMTEAILGAIQKATASERERCAAVRLDTCISLLIRRGYYQIVPECVGDGAQLINGEWHMPRWGCDTLQFVLDEHGDDLV